MTPYSPPRTYGRRRGELPARLPLVLALLGALALVVTLPLAGASLPGMRRAQALVNRLPLPWKAPRPEYVPVPETAAPAAVLAQVTPAPAPTATPAAPPAGAPVALPDVARSDDAPAAVAIAPAPSAVRLEGFRHQWQTWNNCGPATITMATSHYGRPETQVQAAAFVKPNANDKNVSPQELVAFVRSVGLEADFRVAGDIDRLKVLLANGIPVVVETWFTPEPNDGMGHYRLLVGYDDASGRFTAYDSYDGPGVNLSLPYERLDADWRVFNRTYIPVYASEKASLVAAILAADKDDQAMWERSLSVAQQETAARPNDAFSWFNTGASLLALGRAEEAVGAFDRSRSLRLPWRMLWYQFQPFEAYLSAGRLADVLTLTASNLQQASDLEESHYYRGRALQAQGEAAAARGAYQAAVRSNARFAPAHHALATLG